MFPPQSVVMFHSRQIGHLFNRPIQHWPSNVAQCRRGIAMWHHMGASPHPALSKALTAFTAQLQSEGELLNLHDLLHSCGALSLLDQSSCVVSKSWQQPGFFTLIQSKGRAHALGAELLLGISLQVLTATRLHAKPFA